MDLAGLDPQPMAHQTRPKNPNLARPKTRALTPQHRLIIASIGFIALVFCLRVGLKRGAELQRHTGLVKILKRSHQAQAQFFQSQGHYAKRSNLLVGVPWHGHPAVQFYATSDGYIAQACDHEECAYLDQNGIVYFGEDLASPHDSSSAFVIAEAEE